MPELPAPLPPAERTVGQLVGETIRSYGDHFWRALPLGLPLTLGDELSTLRGSLWFQVVLFYAMAPLVVAAYLWACALVLDARPSWGAYLVGIAVYLPWSAYWAGLVASLPYPLLRVLYILPGVAWFALLGLAVPAALKEGTGPRASLRRGIGLGRADYVHALGALVALVVVVGLGELTLAALLRTAGDDSARVAFGLADVVLTPLLYLGGAMLYEDQAARVPPARVGR